jgi:hypothetical protein
MLVSRVIAEFEDYRAYVNHTLCKHRLFLGLGGSAEESRSRLADAAVWPLVKDETLRLLETAPTLFGIVSTPLKRDTPKIRKSLKALDGRITALLSGKEQVIVSVLKSAVDFRDDMAETANVLRVTRPGFNEKAVLRYLGKRSRSSCIESVRECVRGELKAEVYAIVCAASPAGALARYQRYWPVASEAAFRIRVAIVAGAVEEVRESEDAPLREAFRSLHRLDRVISCWSPAIPESFRTERILQALEANALSGPDLLMQFCEDIVRHL